MSLARVFLSGVLVAGGLILGAFTLHGYLDPLWLQKQMHAASQHERASEPKSVNTFQGRSRFVASKSGPQDTTGQLQVVKASAKADAKPIDVAAADAKAAAKAAARKKLAAEKAEKIEKAKQRPQQATFQWPWNLFSK